MILNDPLPSSSLRHAVLFDVYIPLAICAGFVCIRTDVSVLFYSLYCSLDRSRRNDSIGVTDPRFDYDMISYLIGSCFFAADRPG